MALDITTIDTRNGEATALIDNLRERLSPRGDIVSDAGRERTVEIFGEPLSPAQVVDRICGDVASGGLESVLDYTRRLDGVDLTSDTLRVSQDEFHAAHQAADPDYLATIRRIRDNIVEFQSQVLTQDVTVLRQRDSGAGQGTVELTQRYRPLRRVGVCVPGGAAAYPSTLLMTAVPARRSCRPPRCQ